MTDGGGADISYEILDPYNNVLKSGVKVKSVEYQMSVAQTGDYRVCLDNSFSSSATKYMELEVNHDSLDRMKHLVDKFVTKFDDIPEMIKVSGGLVQFF